MKYNQNVCGSIEASQPLIINHDDVYIHTNIKEIDSENQIYEYDEIVMSKDEYLVYLSDKVDLAGDAIQELINYL